MTNVLTVGKYPIVREGLKYICAHAPAVALVGEAEDIEHALMALDKQKYDVVILDHGIEAFEQIKLKHPRLPVLVMSGNDHVRDVSQVIQAGAAGYVSMDSSPEEIMKAIDSVRNGASYISPGLAQKLVLEGVADREEEPHKAVSKREFQVMALIGSGKTLREISEELQISTKTVSVHRDRLLKKMKMKHNTELIRYVLEKGIVE